MHHGKNCECSPCLHKKINTYLERVKLMSKPRFPATIEAAVPVRAHFRRMKGYLKKQPKLHAEVTALIREMIEGEK